MIFFSFIDWERNGVSAFANVITRLTALASSIDVRKSWPRHCETKFSKFFSFQFGFRFWIDYFFNVLISGNKHSPRTGVSFDFFSPEKIHSTKEMSHNKAKFLTNVPFFNANLVWFQSFFLLRKIGHFFAGKWLEQ
jgi:hypothetical protein